ncbi:MAG: BON domain-containing protein [Francisellaceae bacterium]
MIKTVWKATFFGAMIGALAGCTPVVIAGAGAAAAGASIGNSSVESDTTLSDKAIQFRAIGVLNHYPELKNNSNVEPVVFNHILLLLGQVPSASLRAELAHRMAQIQGVDIVYNQLTIGDPVNIGGYVADSWITTKVISELVNHKINSLKYKVVTQKGVVYLMGVVSEQEGQQAAEVAASVSGVTKVVKVFSYTGDHPDDNHINDQAIGSLKQ